MTEKLPWWDKELHSARREKLLRRGRIKKSLRQWFESEGFVEVECSALQTSPGNETHLHGMRVVFEDMAGAQVTRYLHTSPEFAAKKLLAAGENKIFEFARVFRGREEGPINVPEFTMLEWYRTGASYKEMMEDCASLIRAAADCLGLDNLNFNQRFVDLTVQPEILGVTDAFMRYANVDLLSTLEPEGTPNSALLAKALDKAGISCRPEESWSDMFSRVISERIEPNLGNKVPVFLVDYPLPEAALARRSVEDPRLAERFELYIAGIELANGFSELTDASEQRLRFEASMRERQSIYGDNYPIDEDFLAALKQMPEAAGVALGFDRLAMLFAGANSLEEIIWTPFDKGTK